MEVAPCTLEVGHHAASLLKHLNLQREQAQFCDCVLRQRESSGQLFPAHRCLLAASSPVLASILSSNGALVELQDPCLSDSVLAALLDYIYTGALQCIHSQQQYDRLLTAACHLQMKELQEALMEAWEQSELNAAEDSSASQSTGIQAHKNIDDPYRTPLKALSNIPSSHSIDALCGLDETRMQCSSSVGNFCEAQMHSASIDCSIKDGETSISKHFPNCCSITAPNTLSDVNTCCIFKGIDSVNGIDYRQGTYLSRQGLKLNIPGTPEEHEISRGNKKVDEDQFPSAGFEKPEVCQRSTEEVQQRTCEERMSSSSFASSLPRPCCGAVPVICHSSRAAALHPAKEPEVPALFSSSRAFVSHSASADNDKTVEDITTKQKDQHGAQDQEPRHNKEHTHSEFDQDGKSSTTDRFMINNEQKDKSLSLNIEHNEQPTHCDLLQSNPKHHGNDLFQQYRKGLKHKTEDGFDDIPLKYQRLDCFECLSVSLETPTEDRSQDWRAGLPLPIMDTNTGGDPHCEDLCLEMKAQEEHNNFSRCLTEKDTQDNHCNLYGPESYWYPNIYRAEKSRKDAFSTRHEYDPNLSLEAMKHKSHNVNLCLPTSASSESGLCNVNSNLSVFECCKSPEPKNISGATIKEQCPTSIPVDNKMPDNANSRNGLSYHGYLHYPGLPQEVMHLSHQGPDHKNAHPGYSHHSDESSDGDGAGTFTIPGQRPSKQHFAAEDDDQVLLLDTNTQPAEVLVHCKLRSDTKENDIRNHDRAQISKESPAEWRETKKIRKQNNFGAESFDEINAQKNVEEKQSVGKDQNRPEPQVTLKVGDEEISNLNEDENKVITWPVCAAASVPDSVQASMPSTLSVCISSTLSVCVPTDGSAHVSCHQPFQCSLCDRSFSQRGSLNRHVRSHLGVRPFPCPCCPMTFSRQYRVTEHMRVHQRCALGNDFQKPSDSSIKDNKEGPQN